MKNNLPNIYKYSQNLFHVLCIKLTNGISKDVDSEFAYSIANGGLEELDYKRPEGQSYNPRPARIALILINDGLLIDQSLIIAAFQATIDQTENNIAAEAQAICSASELTNAQYSRDAKLLALAIHLDRARHFHLSSSYTEIEARKKFHQLTNKVLDLAGPECKRLNDLLIHWLSRDEKKLTR